MIDLSQMMRVAEGGLDNRLECFRVIYCAWLMAVVVVQWHGHMRWVRVWGKARGMPELFGRVGMPRLGAGAFGLTGLVFLSGLAVAAFGAGNVAGALVVAGVSALVYFSQVIGMPQVRRKPGTVPVILLLLGAAEWAGASEMIGWVCLTTIQVLVAQVYVSSGIVKLRRAGPGWAGGGTLRMSLLRYHLRDGSRAALWLAERPALCQWASVAVLGFELTFWLMIPWPQLAWIYVTLGVAFHFGTAWLMRIHYWIYLFPAYAAFLLAR